MNRRRTHIASQHQAAAAAAIAAVVVAPAPEQPYNKTADYYFLPWTPESNVQKLATLFFRTRNAQCVLIFPYLCILVYVCVCVRVFVPFYVLSHAVCALVLLCFSRALPWVPMSISTFEWMERLAWMCTLAFWIAQPYGHFVVFVCVYFSNIINK